MNNLFPKFVQNRPKGLDKFDGASQTKLAKAIAKQIIMNDALPKEDALPKINQMYSLQKEANKLRFQSITSFGKGIFE